MPRSNACLTMLAMPCWRARSWSSRYFNTVPSVALDRALVELGDTEGAERLRPVDGLGDAGRLVHVEPAHRLDRGRHLTGERLDHVGHADAHDLDLALEVGMLDPVVQAASLQRVVHVAGSVGGEHDDRRPAWW